MDGDGRIEIVMNLAEVHEKMEQLPAQIARCSEECNENIFIRDNIQHQYDVVYADKYTNYFNQGYNHNVIKMMLTSDEDLKNKKLLLLVSEKNIRGKETELKRLENELMNVKHIARLMLKEIENGI